MNDRAMNVLRSFLAAIVVVPIYIFIHEGGHALVSILCGAKITSFSIWGAYMSSEGGNFNTVTTSLRSAAGALLPIIISTVLLLFYKKTSSSKFYHFIMLMAGFISVGSSLAWVLVPILYLNGNAPVLDDATTFLEVSKIHPIIVIIGAIGIITLYIILMWKKQVMQNWWRMIQNK